MKICELLDSPDKLVRNPFYTAEDADGNPVNSQDPTAVRWCLAGAVIKTVGYGQSTMDAVLRTRVAYGVKSFTAYLQETPYDEVIAKVQEVGL